MIYFQSIISTCNQYEKCLACTWTFFLCVLNLWNLACIFTACTAQFAIAKFQVFGSHTWQAASLLDSAGLPKLSNSYTQTHWLNGSIKYYCSADTDREDLRVQARWLVELRPSPRNPLFLSCVAVNSLPCSIKIHQPPSRGGTLC